MGSGKTTLGKMIATSMNLEFIDLDHIITLKTGDSVNSIFESMGEKYFRLKEKETLEELVKKESFVLAVGGGTSCFFNNMEVMNREGLTIYLRLSPGSLFSRLVKRKMHRPLVKNLDDKQLMEYIKTNLSKREKWYLQSKRILEEKNQEPDAILSIIKDYKPGRGSE